MNDKAIIDRALSMLDNDPDREITEQEQKGYIMALCDALFFMGEFNIQNIEDMDKLLVNVIHEQCNMLDDILTLEQEKS